MASFCERLPDHGCTSVTLNLRLTSSSVRGCPALQAARNLMTPCACTCQAVQHLLELHSSMGVAWYAGGTALESDEVTQLEFSSPAWASQG